MIAGVSDITSTPQPVVCLHHPCFSRVSSPAHLWGPLRQDKLPKPTLQSLPLDPARALPALSSPPVHTHRLLESQLDPSISLTPWPSGTFPFLALSANYMHSDANGGSKKEKDRKERHFQKALENNFFFLTPDTVSKVIQNILMLQLFSHK